MLIPALYEKAQSGSNIQCASQILCRTGKNGTRQTGDHGDVRSRPTLQRKMEANRNQLNIDFKEDKLIEFRPASENNGAHATAICRRPRG